MQNEVYADLLFLINFSMDFLCLFLTAQILRQKLRPIPAIVASMIGGAYSITSLFITAHSIYVLLIDVLVCVIMCLVCFAKYNKSARQLLTYCLTYLACATVLGGIMTVLFNLFNRLNLPLNSGGDQISSWLFLLLAIISGVTALRGAKFIKKLPSRRTADIELYFCKKNIKLCGMVDTGNIVHDPISGKPIIIVNAHDVISIIPPQIKDAILSGCVQQLENIPSQYIGKVRLIPGESVSGHCLLIGLVPDKIIISNEKKSAEVSALFAPAVLNSLPHGCSAIIPGDLHI